MIAGPATDERARSQSRTMRVALVCIVLGLVMLLAACTPKTPPAVFAEPVQALVEPEPFEPPVPEHDDLVETAAMLPGRRVPGVDDHGLATARAILVPPTEYALLLYDGLLADHWGPEARRSHYWRGVDREVCEEVSAVWWEDRRSLAVENRMLRPTVFVALGGGFAVGAVFATWLGVQVTRAGWGGEP